MSKITVDNLRKSSESADRDISGVAAAWAWVDHKTDNAIDNSINVSSLTDNGTGLSTTNLTNAMSSVKSVVQFTSYQSGTAQLTGNGGASMTSTSAVYCVTNDTGAIGQEDTEYGMLLHGDLA